MTPKEKAVELIKKYEPFVYGFIGSSMLTNTEDQSVIKMNAKQCALIAVDEIIKSRPSLPELLNGGYLSEEILLSNWLEVKQEIEKL